MDEMCKQCWNDSCRKSGELYMSNKLAFCKRELEEEYDDEEDDEGEEYD